MIDADLEKILLPVQTPEEAVILLFGRTATIGTRRAVGGGSINDTALLELSSGETIFLKENDLHQGSLFQEEARGLVALARAPRGPRVPRPLGLFSGKTRQYLLMEYVPSGRPRGDFFTRFGRALARLHRSCRNRSCGFARDNHIGATPQPNPWTEDWIRFFSEQRLRFQGELARARGLWGTRDLRSLESLVKRLPDLLPQVDQGEASLLHGDLWGGNFMADSDNAPVLIDPAVYFGHREADLAMTELFGGFSPAFYEGYRQEWPLEPGYGERKDIYNLYHLMNHMNLFGGSYRASCQAILRRFS
ncbi:Fructosamine-3-kinase [Alkalispirochaeta americana]|uniref:Fructosamine-3-kinase n=1 Tax=Alkalispirochaeta americana TaxID=159291 RepID=A0A1N6NFB2_9SPIO|nr:fructosamine kinase family protein [Alkalispirochaeta americana]SIP90733.1 Fructosamine-3-kinase [Alkalispirochaeta americana]